MIIMWRPPGCIFWTKELYLHPCAPLTSILILYRPNYVRESRRKSHIVATNLQATAAVAAASLQNHTVGSIIFWRSSLLSQNITKNLSNIWRNHIFPLSVFKFTLNCTKHNGNTSPFYSATRFLQFLEIWLEKSGWRNLVPEKWLTRKKGGFIP